MPLQEARTLRVHVGLQDLDRWSALLSTSSHSPYLTSHHINSFHIISRHLTSLTGWEKDGAVSFPDNANFDNVCPHGGLNLTEQNHVRITPKLWDYLFALNPASTVLSGTIKNCSICVEERRAEIDSRASVRKERDLERVRPQLRNLS